MSRRLKVLIVPSWYPQADLPTHGVFVQQQAEALAAVCDVAVLHVPLARAATPAKVAQEGVLTVVRAMPPEQPNLSAFSRRLGNVRELTFSYRRACIAAFDQLHDAWGKPDIIHAHASIPASLGARILSRHLGVPYVVTEHQAEFLPESPGLRSSSGRIVPWMVRGAMRQADAVIAVSRHLADALTASGYSDDPLVIPNLVPGAMQPAQPFAVPANSVPRLAHVSLLSSYEKNIPMLLDALNLVDERGVECLMQLAGDGPDRAALEARASELGLLNRRVRFLGARSTREVRELFDEASFSIVSSRYETFSMAAAESLAAGRPVVCTRCGGPEDFVDESVGLLVRNDDSLAMADAVEWMCAHYEEYDPMALHKHAALRFSSDVVVNRLVELYWSILGGDTIGVGSDDR